MGLTRLCAGVLACSNASTSVTECPREYDFVERHGNRGGDALDVGCGTGEFLLALRDRGWSVLGQEVNANAAGIAIEAGLDVRTCSLDRCGFEAESFDLVTLWDVVEHLPDPVSTLREIRRILRPGGLLVLSTPDLKSLDSRLFAGWWHGLEIPRHLVLFGPETMRQALQRAGFEKVERKYISGSYHVRLLSVQALITRSASAMSQCAERCWCWPACLCGDSRFGLYPNSWRGPE